MAPEAIHSKHQSAYLMVVLQTPQSQMQSLDSAGKSLEAVAGQCVRHRVKPGKTQGQLYGLHQQQLAAQRQKPSWVVPVAEPGPVRQTQSDWLGAAGQTLQSWPGAVGQMLLSWPAAAQLLLSWPAAAQILLSWPAAAQTLLNLPHYAAQDLWGCQNWQQEVTDLKHQQIQSLSCWCQRPARLLAETCHLWWPEQLYLGCQLLQAGQSLFGQTLVK